MPSLIILPVSVFQICHEDFTQIRPVPDIQEVPVVMPEPSNPAATPDMPNVHSPPDDFPPADNVDQDPTPGPSTTSTSPAISSTQSKKPSLQLETPESMVLSSPDSA